MKGKRGFVSQIVLLAYSELDVRSRRLGSLSCSDELTRL